MPRVSLDTNVLVYAVDSSAGDKNAICRDILRAAALADGILTQQVIGEFLNVSRKMTHLNQRRLRRVAVGLAATFPILPTPRDALFDAFDLSADRQIQFWDAVILTVCSKAGVTSLITEDLQDGSVIDGVSIINPFRLENRSMLDECLAR